MPRLYFVHYVCMFFYVFGNERFKNYLLNLHLFCRVFCPIGWKSFRALMFVLLSPLNRLREQLQLQLHFVHLSSRYFGFLYTD